MDSIEIVEALKTLKSMCHTALDCKNCPCALPKLSEKGKTVYCCGLTDIAPCHWYINEEDCRLEDNI